MANEPVIKLQPGGQASIINYNVPERTSYPMQGLIEVPLPKRRQRFFKDKYYGAATWRPNRPQTPLAELAEAVQQAIQKNYFPRTFFPNMQLRQSSVISPDRGRPPITVAQQGDNVGGESVPRILRQLDADVVAQRMQDGEELAIYRNFYGTHRMRYVTATSNARPRLYLVEKYRLTSFLGDYGAGRTLNTFSLLPGEKTTLSIKTYKKTSQTSALSSSVLDSFSEESAKEFEDQVTTENGSKSTEEDSFSYYLDGEASGGIDIGIASAGGGVQSGFKGSSNSGREDFSKTVTSATQKHAAKASASRDVEINTSFEATSEDGEETETERLIENINVGRTLNFVFRQMNQEFVSLFHLVDVRVGFTNGFRGAHVEQPIHKLDELLDTVMATDEELRSLAKASILDELHNVFDLNGVAQSIIEERPLIGPDGLPSSERSYTRVKKDMLSEFAGKEVPGIILSASRNTMRTDGVIVEALLGQAEALDTYSKSLQEKAIEEKHLANEMTSARIDRERLAQQVIRDHDAEAARLFLSVFPPPTISADSAKTTVDDDDV